MKKAYFAFAIVMVVAVTAFISARYYLTMQEQEAQRVATKEMIGAELNKFKVTVDSRIDESEKAFLDHLDSLTGSYEEPGDLGVAVDSLGIPIPDSIAVDSTMNDSKSDTVSTSSVKESETVALENKAIAVTDSTDSGGPSEQDNEIYIRYLKKRWALPTDLTKYELAVAKQEIMAEVGKDYDLNADEILGVVDKVYEYRQALKQGKN